MNDEKKLPDDALNDVTGGLTPLHEQRLPFDEFKQQVKQLGDQENGQLAVDGNLKQP